MADTPTLLRELHRIHRQATDLRERLERGPKQIRASDANVQRCEQELEAAREKLKQCRIAADDRQLQLKGREDRIGDLDGKLKACGSNREYQALKEQIAADEQANSVLSDEILEMLEKLDDYESQVAAAEESLAKSRAESEKVKQRVREKLSGLEEELARVTGNLHEAEAKLPSDLRADYNRVVKGRGEDALAELDGECCGSCYQMATPQTLNEVHSGKAVFCKSCGCLLYAPEDRSVGGTS